jgi:anaerobic selenocysteine-containing dehydrogenase
MTNSWTDIRNTDLVVIMGGNAAEAHPCGFKWVTEAKANRGAKLIVIDPRFTRSAAVADFYAPIRQGTDIAFLLGIINYCIQNDKVQWDYVKAFTNAAHLVKEGFGTLAEPRLVAELAGDLGLPVGFVAEARNSRYFGEAWQMLDASSNRLRRRPVPAAAVHEQIALAQAFLTSMEGSRAEQTA